MQYPHDPGLWTRRAFLGALAALGLAGCGGGGGGGSSPASGGVQADLTRFTPNYAGSVTLDHWPSLPVRVYFSNDLTVTPAGGSATRVNDLIQAGFNRWPAATNGVVGYAIVTDPAQAQITVTVTQIPDPSGQAETGQTTIQTAVGNVLTAAAIQIYVWPDITTAELTLGQVETSCHEFGHALGIGGHSPDPGDVMYAQHDPSRDVQLTVSDVNTIKTIYASLFPG